MKLPIGFYKVAGKSMEPSYYEGDYVLVQRLTPPKPGDAVVLRDPRNGQEVLKRVARIKNNQYYVLGDNPEHNTDSRTYGWVGRKKIFGKLWIKIGKD